MSVCVFICFFYFSTQKKKKKKIGNAIGTEKLTDTMTGRLSSCTTKTSVTCVSVVYSLGVVIYNRLYHF